MAEATAKVASKRMPKAQRRRQLLATAYEIVRSEGTDALTLARLAERAGVTKPIAYEHFGTRAGLLAALYRDYEEQQTRAMHAALAAGGKTLDDVASIVSAAYVDCVLSAGPACDDIAAALSAFEETKDFLQSSRDYNIMELRKAFAPFVKLPRQRGTAILAGILGAADALSRGAATGRLSRAEAVGALSRIMIGALRANPVPSAFLLTKAPPRRCVKRRPCLDGDP
jgi:AcrR family transcriptional regulator